MFFRNLHPDLKLGLVLVVAAALLQIGDPGKLGALAAAERVGSSFTGSALAWFVYAYVFAGVAVVGPAIWVDQRPPHTMMAAGAVVAVVGLVIIGFSNSFPVSVLGFVVAGVGGSALGSLVFYAIAVKGAPWYRGTLVGALSMVFIIGNRAYTNTADQPFDSPVFVLATSAALTLAGAVVVFGLLPRVFASSYESGPTLRPTLAQPSVRRAAAWLTAAFFTASAATPTVIFFLPFLALTASELEYRGFTFSALPIFGGLGALLWGIAADFYPGRRLLLLAALLLLPTSGLFWALDGQPESLVAFAAFGLIMGGLITLPWVLMAELLPTRHFAKIAVGIMLVGGWLGRASGALLGVFFLNKGVLEGLLAVVVLGGIAVAVVAILLPKPQASESQERS